MSTPEKRILCIAILAAALLFLFSINQQKNSSKVTNLTLISDQLLGETVEENATIASLANSSLIAVTPATMEQQPPAAPTDAVQNLSNADQFVPIIYNESQLAHQLLDGKRGIEIGASMHNPYGLDALNLDYTDDASALFQKAQVEVSGSAAKVDIITPGDKLPFANNSVDFVINSHVLEHFYDPIQAIEEWLRVVKPGGFVYMDIPHKERTFDRDKNRTTLAELLVRHTKPIMLDEATHHGHQSVWITEDLLELCRHFNWTVVEWRDTDDKLGIGFTIVLKKDM